MSGPSLDAERLEERKSRLSATRREQLRERLRGRSPAATRGEIGRRPNPVLAPLSFAQERLWFLDRLDEGSWTYNFSYRFDLDGELDVPRLRRALQRVVRRHEVLRTRFAEVDGHPVQLIEPTAAVPLPVVDLSSLPERHAETEARRLRSRQQHRPFDLAAGGLLRCLLLRRAAAAWSWLLALHHIVFDGWSLSVLFREVSWYYDHGAGDELPELPVQYGDYAHWQRRRLEGPALDRLLAYWLDRLGGAPDEPLELPFDRPRPEVQTHRGALVARRLPPQLGERARELAGRHGATLFAVLLAAFEALLSRYTGRSDLVVGTPVAHRERPEVEGLVGFFVNTLALRSDLSGDPSFATAVDRCAETVLGALAHQELPFERLVDELKLRRRLDSTPLFQVSFVLHNAPAGGLTLGGLRASRPRTGSTRAQFDLSLELTPTDDGLLAAVELNRDLFDTSTVERLLDHYQALLSGALADPSQRLSRLPMLSPAERHRVLVEWSGAPPTPAGPARCLHRPVFEQAALTPDAVAVEAGRLRLTYGDLATRAEALAARLRASGVGPEHRVAVLTERCPAMVVGVLGILAAGGAYVPLDLRSPRRRLETQAAELGIAVVVADRPSTPEAEKLGLHVVQVEISGPLAGDAASAAAVPEAVPQNPVAAENLAYVLHTSGSTGRPKGVMVKHGAAAAYASFAADSLRIAPEDRLLQFASLSFDTSVEEIFATLSRGATLVLRSDDMLASPQVFLRDVEENGITLLDLSTGYWHVLADHLAETGGTLPPAVRAVVIGGEAASRRRLQRWLRQVPDRRLINSYGPTEGTVVAAECELDAVPEAGRPVPIGHPVGGAVLYVLGRHLEPLPPGVPGQLFIAGQRLARGYAGRPAATAEVFVPDPFAARPGARMYASGDRVRHHPSGRLEFLDRIDQQVKLMSQRVEPGEIEAVLTAHPGVERCAVVVRGEGGEARLVAYAVAAGGGAPEERELLDFLRDRLPMYMVPRRVVMLPELPLTSSGKIDRRALPEPPARRRTAAGRQAESDLERAVVAVWRQVLEIDRIGLDDNFFDLGGNSLLLVQVHARLRAGMPDAELRLIDLFRHPTVAALVERLEGGDEEAGTEQARQRADDRRSGRGRQRRRAERRRAVRDAADGAAETRPAAGGADA